MSRLGKKPILIPEKITVSLTGNTVLAKGPLGELKRDFRDDIEIKIDNNQIELAPKRNDRQSKMLWGTYVSHIKNMINGVKDGFKKVLIIEGVGYKAKIEGSKIIFSLGLSHPVEMEISAGLKIEVEKSTMTITGIDKDLVGSTASKIRALKKPEPYKGKGIRYEGEVIRRKTGKKAASSS